MNDIERSLASFALDSGSTEDANTALTSSPPFLPPELIALIVKLAVDLLVEEERYLPSQIPLTNRFLLSAALANRTWHSIATSALLENGLVRPGSIRGFMSQLEKYGRKKKLSRVRFGAGSKGLIADDSDPPDEGADDAAFKVLLDSLPKIRTLEIVGIGLRIKVTLGRLRLRRIIISNSSSEVIHDLTRALQSVANVVHLDLIETQQSSAGSRNVPNRTIAVEFLSAVRSIDVYTNQDRSGRYINALCLLADYFRPQSLRLAYIDTLAGQDYWRFLTEIDQMVLAMNPNREFSEYSYPTLSHLATHLAPLHYIAVHSGVRSPLTSLEIIRDFTPEVGIINDEEAFAMVLELVYTLPILKELKVPACWRSDAVEDACEAKGVDLTWT